MALLVAAAMLVNCVPATARAQADDTASARERLDAVEAKLQALEQRLETRRSERDVVAEKLRESDLALAELVSSVRTHRKRLDALQARLTALRGELETLSARERRLREALAEHLRGAWLLGRTSPLELLLQAERPERVARLMTYRRRIAAAQQARIEVYRETIAKREAAQRELTRRERTLARTRAQLATERKGLQRARRRQAETLAQLESGIAADRATRSALRANRTRLVKLLERLERQANQNLDGESFAAHRGQLPWPVAGPIRQAFGTSGARGQTRFNGVTLAAAAGTRVRAVHAGTVVFADWMRGFGLMVIVDHGGGYMTLYAHNESLLREAGARVESGEPLATAGRSGGASHNGVYFEIRDDGKPQDPAAWCSDRA